MIAIVAVISSKKKDKGKSEDNYASEGMALGMLIGLAVGFSIKK